MPFPHSATPRSVYTGHICEAPVRFVSSPLQFLDTPWCVVDDLWKALGLDAEQITNLGRSIHQSGARFQMAYVEEKLVQIIPTWAFLCLCDQLQISKGQSQIIKAFTTMYADVPPFLRMETVMSAPSLIEPTD